MGIIQNHDWRTLGQEFRNAKPFPNICIDNFLDPAIALEIANSYPSFSDAKSFGHVFNKVNERGKAQITDSDNFPVPVSKLYKALAGEEFLLNMQELSGIEDLKFDDTFSGGGMHMTSRSGILDVHVDFNQLKKIGMFRRLNILIYFNEKWESSWGGNIELWDKDVLKCEKSISPIMNRCLIFATSDHSFHGVTAVESPEGISRNSFAIYLYTDISDTEANIRPHSTIFKARPDEKLKKYVIMPAETYWIGLKKNTKRLKRFLRDRIVHD